LNGTSIIATASRRVQSASRSLRRRLMRRMASFRARRMEVSKAAGVILAPHPDDEVFAAGGLIALKRQAGAAVDIVFFSDGEATHEHCCDITPPEVGAARRHLAVQALATLGVTPEHLHWLGLPDRRIPAADDEAFPQAAARLATLLRRIAPREVFLPHAMEPWRDHRAAAEIAQAAIRGTDTPGAVYSYLVWGWFKPRLFRLLGRGLGQAVALDVSAVRAAKRSAIDTYFDATAPTCGKPYCGVLPHGFTEGFDSPREFFWTSTSPNQGSV